MLTALHGASGLTKEFPLESWARNADDDDPRWHAQIRQLIVGRELTGLRAFA